MVKLKTKKIEVIKQQKREEKKEKWQKQYADNREENAAKARERMRALRKARKEEKEAEARAETRALVRTSAKQSSAARKKKLQRQREKGKLQNVLLNFARDEKMRTLLLLHMRRARDFRVGQPGNEPLTKPNKQCLLLQRKKWIFLRK